MPAYLTHRTVGELVFGTLDRKTVPDHRAFYMGCQGPDILYHNFRPIKCGFPLGFAMHGRKTRELLSHAMEYPKNCDCEDKEGLISYLAGFITHYAADKNLHPIVYRKCGKRVLMHHALEHLWDRFLVRDGGLEARRFDVKSDMMNGDIGKSVLSWYAAAARDVYGKHLDEATVKQAVVQFSRTEQGRLTRNRHFNRVFRLITGFKIEELLQTNRSDESFFSKDEQEELRRAIGQSVREAGSLIRSMSRYIDGEEGQPPVHLMDRNFSGDALPVSEIRDDAFVTLH